MMYMLPINFLNCINTLVTRITTDIIRKNIDENQPRELVGYRKGYSTIDHLHSINQLIEKTSEYNIPLKLTCIDYKKTLTQLKQQHSSHQSNSKGHTLDYLLDPICKLQKKIIKAIKKARVTRNVLFFVTRHFDIIPFKYRVGLSMIKFNKGFLPKVIREQFRINSNVHHYDTRQGNHLHVYKGIHTFMNISLPLDLYLEHHSRI